MACLDVFIYRGEGESRAAALLLTPIARTAFDRVVFATFRRPPLAGRAAGFSSAEIGHHFKTDAIGPAKLKLPFRLC